MTAMKTNQWNSITVPMISCSIIGLKCYWTDMEVSA